MLTVSSLITIVLTLFHLADDIARGFEPGGVDTYTGLLIAAVWVYGALVLAERRSGHVIMLLGSLLGAGIPLIHMTGAGLAGGRIAGSDGRLFFIWTLLALGVTALFSFILSARGLWSLWRQPRQPG
jgi:NO-binding membrane sensor protein with MHYT domain